MEAWSKVEGDNIELAKIRVYNKDPRTGKQRIVLLVPSNPEAEPDVKDADTDEYEMDMVNEAVENQIVVAEREKAPGSRARTTILTGRIKHDCNLRPVFTEKYRKRMKERTIKANTPARTIRMIDEVEKGRGAVNILNSGVGPSSSAFLNITVSNQLCTTWRVRSHLPLFTESETEGCEGVFRALYAYAAEPASRHSICPLSGKASLVCKRFASAHGAA